ncbi:hypothetical protein DXG01_000547 [Tephrocybe rancida]|nr:hypothetical protein DXG01_000547 [Tephrocybe rancida]
MSILASPLKVKKLRGPQRCKICPIPLGLTERPWKTECACSAKARREAKKKPSQTPVLTQPAPPEQIQSAPTSTEPAAPDVTLPHVPLIIQPAPPVLTESSPLMSIQHDPFGLPQRDPSVSTHPEPFVTPVRPNLLTLQQYHTPQHSSVELFDMYSTVMPIPFLPEFNFNSPRATTNARSSPPSSPSPIPLFLPGSDASDPSFSSPHLSMSDASSTNSSPHSSPGYLRKKRAHKSVSGKTRHRSTRIRPTMENLMFGTVKGAMRGTAALRKFLPAERASAESGCWLFVAGHHSSCTSANGFMHYESPALLADAYTQTTEVVNKFGATVQALLTLEKQEVHKLNDAFIQVSKQKEIAEEEASRAREELASKINENTALQRVFENLMNGNFYCLYCTPHETLDLRGETEDSISVLNALAQDGRPVIEWVRQGQRELICLPCLTVTLKQWRSWDLTRVVCTHGGDCREQWWCLKNSPTTPPNLPYSPAPSRQWSPPQSPLWSTTSPRLSFSRPPSPQVWSPSPTISNNFQCSTCDGTHTIVPPAIPPTIPPKMTDSDVVTWLSWGGESCRMCGACIRKSQAVQEISDTAKGDH